MICSFKGLVPEVVTLIMSPEMCVGGCLGYSPQSAVWGGAEKSYHRRSFLVNTLNNCKNYWFLHSINKCILVSAMF